jgi:uncharacterized coiled-coil DUF342 family protein
MKIDKTMLTNEDVKKLLEVLATKEDIKELKEDMSGLRESVQALTVSVDRLAKAVEDMHQEFVAITAKVDRHEKWLHQIAEKLGIKLEY